MFLLYESNPGPTVAFQPFALHQSHGLNQRSYGSFLSEDLPVALYPPFSRRYSSLFMRQVCFSMFMVARSVELVNTSRASSCRSSSVSASRARFFSCMSICERKKKPTHNPNLYTCCLADIMFCPTCSHAHTHMMRRSCGQQFFFKWYIHAHCSV